MELIFKLLAIPGALDYIAHKLARTGKASAHIDVYPFGAFLTTVLSQVGISYITSKCGITGFVPHKEGSILLFPTYSCPLPSRSPALKAMLYCVDEYERYYFAWGCCELETATCSADHNCCYTHKYYVWNLEAGTCQIVKSHPYYLQTFK
ncbi:hypothetical protein IFM89_001828, partial [Coptis chinensis]